MYVCLCNAFTDRDVNRAIDDGARTAGQVYKRLEAVPQCGKCKDTIREMVSARHALPSPLGSGATVRLAGRTGDRLNRRYSSWSLPSNRASSAASASVRRAPSREWMAAA